MRVKTKSMIASVKPKLFPYGEKLSLEHIEALADNGYTRVKDFTIRLDDVTDASVVEEQIAKEINGKFTSDYSVEHKGFFDTESYTYPTASGDNSTNNTSMRVFESGSVRDRDDHKPLPSDLHPYARLRYGYHMRKNARKYSKGNWELGQPSEALLESMHRHLAQYELGDRKEDHLSALMFGVKMLMLNEMREGVKEYQYFE